MCWFCKGSSNRQLLHCQWLHYVHCRRPHAVTSVRLCIADVAYSQVLPWYACMTSGVALIAWSGELCKGLVHEFCSWSFTCMEQLIAQYQGNMKTSAGRYCTVEHVRATIYDVCAGITAQKSHRTSKYGARSPWAFCSSPSPTELAHRQCALLCRCSNTRMRNSLSADCSVQSV